MQPANTEFTLKVGRLRELLDQHAVDGLLLRRVSSFAWATCGAASYVNTATSEGAASLLVTRERLYLATNTIEAPRLEEEEKLGEQGWEFLVSPWDNPLQALHSLSCGLILAADAAYPGAKDLGAEIGRLRSHLTPEEGERMRALGRLCAAAMASAGPELRPGMSEYQVAALLGAAAQQRGVQPIVNLVATDGRAYEFRHPLPTEKRLDKYAVLVLSGRRWGLTCSITRLVHFGPPPEDLQRRILATAQVNATLIAHSRPGCSLSEVLHQGVQAYAAAGFPEEWRRHHQGGVAGYEPREALGTTAARHVITAGQALAWNPSIAGAKMEDTVLAGEGGNEVLTSTPEWPVLPVQVPGQPGEVPCALALEI